MKRISFFLVIWIFSFCSSPLLAQTPIPGNQAAADPSSQAVDEKIRNVLEILKDPNIQKRIETLQDDPAPREIDQSASLQQAIDKRLEETKTQITGLFSTLTTIPGEAERAHQLILADTTPTQLWLTFLFLPLLFFIGLLAEELLWRIFRPCYWKVLDVPRTRPIERLGALLFRLLYAFISVAAFAIFSLGLFLTLDWPDVSRLIIVTYLTIFIALRLTWRLSKIVFSPKAEQLRLLPIDNRSAYFFRSWIGIVIGVTVLFSTTGQVLRDVGFSAGTKNLFTLLSSLIVTILTSFVILRGRRLLKAGSPHLIGRKLDLWPILMVGALIIAWFALLLGFAPLNGTIIVLAFLPVVLISIEAVIATAVKTPPERPDSEEQSPDAQHQEALRNAAKPVPVSPYELMVERGLRSFILVGGAYWIVTFWGVDIIGMAFQDSIKAPFAAAIFNIVLTLLVADLLWQFAASLIDSHLKEVPIDGEHLPDMSRKEARLQTLLPILRLFLMAVIWIVTAMICLSTLGVNIGPLLAGAGVIGIAIGFGAQTLVKDIVSGIFFLLDDAFRVGEYIESGNIRGTVEAMSLRSLRLRHHRGQLHTVPFGDLKAITNHSRDWVIMKLELGLTYDTDLELVRKTVKEIGKMMLADPEVGANILEPLKSQGVNRLGDFNLVVRVKFKCKPGQQFLARRVAFKLIQEIFPQRGIKFAFPTVTIADGSDKEGEALAANMATKMLAEKQPAS